MLKVRVIPTLLWKDTTLVKGVGFDSWRRVGSMLPAIKVYNTRQVDELIIVDINATRMNIEPDYNSIEEFSAECFVPVTIGGGIKKIEDVKKLLVAGADKISINTVALYNPEIIDEVARKFGTQCVIVSIDSKRNPDGKYICYSHSGTQNTGHDVIDWAKEAADRGAGEILLTSIDNDGTMKGYDIELIKAVTEVVSIPVIASGGAGNYEHLVQAVKLGGASAVAAASIFHFTQQTPLEAKRYLRDHGVFTRL